MKNDYLLNFVGGIICLVFSGIFFTLSVNPNGFLSASFAIVGFMLIAKAIDLYRDN